MSPCCPTPGLSCVSARACWHVPQPHQAAAGLVFQSGQRLLHIGALPHFLAARPLCSSISLGSRNHTQTWQALKQSLCCSPKPVGLLPHADIRPQSHSTQACARDSPSPSRSHNTHGAAAYALGFLDCDNISARCMLSIFQFFATKTDASVLRMLSGSPAERLLKPISEYITQRGGRIHTRTGCRSVPQGYWVLRVLCLRGGKMYKIMQRASAPARPRVHHPAGGAHTHPHRLQICDVCAAWTEAACWPVT